MSPQQYLDEFFQWIVAAALRHENIQVNDVIMFTVPEGMQNAYVDKAGGGAYVPSTYKSMALKMMNHGLETDRIVAGRTIMVKAEPKIETDVAVRMSAALILWHEFGHALGHPNRKGYGEKPEERAWVFELKAVYEAFETGKLAHWGIAAAQVRDVMQKRRGTYDSDFTSQDIRGKAIKYHGRLMQKLG